MRYQRQRLLRMAQVLAAGLIVLSAGLGLLARGSATAAPSLDRLEPGQLLRAPSPLPHPVYLPFATRAAPSGGLAEASPEPTPPNPEPTPPSEPFADSSPALGVEMLWGLDERWGLDRVGELGVHWVRTPYLWQDVEAENTTPDHYQWAFYDRTFAQSGAMGLEVIAILSVSPSWAAPLSCGPLYPGAYGDFEEFVEASVARYSKPPYNVHFWEFYNEPDNADHDLGLVIGGCFGDHPEQYAELLRHAYAAVKRADPSAQVVLGGLAMDWVGNGPFNTGGPFVWGFLEELLARERPTAPLFDVVNIHYYPMYRTVWEQFGPDLIGKVNYVRDILAAKGVAKPVILTEVGMYSGQRPGGQEWGSTEGQSRYLVQAMVRSLAARLPVAIWYLLADDGTPAEWGLLKWDGPWGNANSLAPRPSFEAFRQLYSRLAAAVYLGPLAPMPRGLEGYRFRVSTGAEVAVVWSEAGDEVTLSLPGEAIAQTDRYGTTCEWRDGDDGREDSLVALPVGPDPVYLQSSREALPPCASSRVIPESSQSPRYEQ